MRVAGCRGRRQALRRSSRSAPRPPTRIRAGKGGGDSTRISVIRFRNGGIGGLPRLQRGWFAFRCNGQNADRAVRAHTQQCPGTARSHHASESTSFFVFDVDVGFRDCVVEPRPARTPCTRSRSSSTTTSPSRRASARHAHKPTQGPPPVSAALCWCSYAGGGGESGVQGRATLFME